MVELPGDSQAELDAAARELIALAGAPGHVIAAEPRQAAAIWRIREDGAGLVARPPGGRPHHAGWEDAAVPPEGLGSYLREFGALLAGHRLEGLPYGHFGDGCVHIRIDFEFGSPAGTAAFRAFLTDAADLVAAHGGSMSGEHGDGRARGELLPRMYSPAALAAMADVKAIFDPGGILNPGVIAAPRPLDADLRPARRHSYRAGLGFRFEHDDGDFGSAVSRCTGVGKCRADLTAGGGVMCPSYQATRDEKDSTRARARVLQELVSGAVPGRWRSAEVAESLDLCLACKACSSDCPTGTDMATYKAEALYQRYRGRLRPAAHYSLGWLPRWAPLAARMPRLANAALTLPVLAAAGSRLAGVDRAPEAAGVRPPDVPRLVRPPEAPPDGNPVVLWADTFTNYFTPQVGIAAVRCSKPPVTRSRCPVRATAAASPGSRPASSGRAGQAEPGAVGPRSRPERRDAGSGPGTVVHRGLPRRRERARRPGPGARPERPSGRWPSCWRARPAGSRPRTWRARPPSPSRTVTSTRS